MLEILIYTIQYALMGILNLAIAWFTFQKAVEWKKESNPAWIAAGTASIANIVCFFFTIGIYIHAMYFGQ